jgi:hypothetical protein
MLEKATEQEGSCSLAASALCSATAVELLPANSPKAVATAAMLWMLLGALQRHPNLRSMEVRLLGLMEFNPHVHYYCLHVT